MHPVQVPDETRNDRIGFPVRNMQDIQTGHRQGGPAGQGGEQRGQRFAGATADRQQERFQKRNPSLSEIYNNKQFDRKRRKTCRFTPGKAYGIIKNRKNRPEDEGKVEKNEKTESMDRYRMRALDRWTDSVHYRPEPGRGYGHLAERGRKRDLPAGPGSHRSSVDHPEEKRRGTKIRGSGCCPFACIRTDNRGDCSAGTGRCPGTYPRGFFPPSSPAVFPPWKDRHSFPQCPRDGGARIHRAHSPR